MRLDADGEGVAVVDVNDVLCLNLDLVRKRIGVAYERRYDTASMAAKIGMVRIIAPELVDLMLDMLDDMRDRDMENFSGGSDWRECACGEEIARNACDGSGRYIDSEPHTCALTVLREVLSLAGER